MIERQVFVTWYTPEEKLPEEGMAVVATVSGTAGCVTFDHALVIAEWFDDGSVWEIEGFITVDITVHAWCDIAPYGWS